MKKIYKILLYSFIGFISIIVILLLFMFSYTTYLYWPDNYKCWKGGGSWDSFPTGCHDECYYLNHDRVCTEAFSAGCECGPDKCWNGNKCISNSLALNS